VIVDPWKVVAVHDTPAELSTGPWRLTPVGPPGTAAG